MIQNSQTNFKKIKKRIILILLISSIILSPLFSFLSHQANAADLINIEILTDLHLSNTSQTTPTDRWAPGTKEQQVTFSLEGNQLGEVSTNLSGKKMGVIVIPPELQNLVTPEPTSTVNTSVRLKLSSLSLLQPVLNAVGDLVKLLGDILEGTIGSLLGVNINVSEVFESIDLLNSLDSFTELSFQTENRLSEDGRLIIVEIDDGLVPILTENVTGVLTNLADSVNLLKAEPTSLLGAAAALAINTALAPIKGILSTVINSAVRLLSGVGEGVGQLLNLSILGNTQIHVPTTISAPAEMLDDLDATFAGTVVRTAAIDLQIFANSTNYSTIYFEGEKFSLETTSIPSVLDFGTHAVQTKEDERLTAYNADGTQSTGQLSVTDTRSTVKNWSLKVRSEAVFEDQNPALAASSFILQGGGLVSDFQGDNLTSIANTELFLPMNQQATLLAVTDATESGDIHLGIDRFELFVPKDQPKTTGSYQSRLIWTISDTP